MASLALNLFARQVFRSTYYLRTQTQYPLPQLNLMVHHVRTEICKLFGNTKEPFLANDCGIDEEEVDAEVLLDGPIEQGSSIWSPGASPSMESGGQWDQASPVQHPRAHLEICKGIDPSGMLFVYTSLIPSRYIIRTLSFLHHR